MPWQNIANKEGFLGFFSFREFCI